MKLDIDEYLRKFGVFKNIEKLVDTFNLQYPEQELTLSKNKAEGIYKKFYDSIVEFQDDFDVENFTSCMNCAFYTKGTFEALKWYFAAGGLVTKEIYLEYPYNGGYSLNFEDWDRSDLPKLVIKIKELTSPFVSKFVENVKEIIPELIWNDFNEIPNIKIEIIKLFGEVTQDISMRVNNTYLLILDCEEI